MIDERTPDPYDGGCPADCCGGQVTQSYGPEYYVMLGLIEAAAVLRNARLTYSADMIDNHMRNRNRKDNP